MRLFRLFMLWLTFLAVQGIKLITRQLLVPRTWSGIPAEREEFPWQASLMRREIPHRDNIWKTFCGGVLIAHNLVLTAAHCMVPNDTRTFMNKVFCQPKPAYEKEDLDRNVRVAVGHFYSDSSPRNEEPLWSRILAYRYPEDYDYPSSDVCVIIELIFGSVGKISLMGKLGWFHGLLILRTIHFDRSEHVAEIPIAGMDIDYGHITCIITGYGYDSTEAQDNPQESENLVWAHVRLLPKRECDKRLEGETQEIICIGGRRTAVALGNSGSALVCNCTGDPREHKRKGIVVGIVLGTTQDGTTTVFTRLSAHKHFLSENFSAAQKMSSPKYCIFIGFAIISFN